MDNILQEIKDERAYQDGRWGGHAHDDQHGPNEWIAFITAYAGKAFYCCDEHPADLLEFRRNMIKVAALAVAAVEWADRKDFFEGLKTQ